MILVLPKLEEVHGLCLKDCFAVKWNRTRTNMLDQFKH